MQESTVWDVYLGFTLIDTVFFSPAVDAEYVRRALIEHDGYDPSIVVLPSI
jgi:hypothetical protein